MVPVHHVLLSAFNSLFQRVCVFLGCKCKIIRFRLRVHKRYSQEGARLLIVNGGGTLGGGPPRPTSRADTVTETPRGRGGRGGRRPGDAQPQPLAAPRAAPGRVGSEELRSGAAPCERRLATSSRFDEHPKTSIVAQAATPKSDVPSEVRSLRNQHRTIVISATYVLTLLLW
jgi:hypothetical protein